MVTRTRTSPGPGSGVSSVLMRKSSATGMPTGRRARRTDREEGMAQGIGWGRGGRRIALSGTSRAAARIGTVSPQAMP